MSNKDTPQPKTIFLIQPFKDIEFYGNFKISHLIEEFLRKKASFGNLIVKKEEFYKEITEYLLNFKMPELKTK